MPSISASARLAVLALAALSVSAQTVSTSPSTVPSGLPSTRPSASLGAADTSLRITRVWAFPPTARGSGTVVSVDPVQARLADGMSVADLVRSMGAAVANAGTSGTAPGARAGGAGAATQAGGGTLGATGGGRPAARAPITWQYLEANADGLFEDRRLVGGWAYAEVESEIERVVLLRAAGNLMVYADDEPRAGDVYSHGYSAIPVRFRAGTNTLLFQVGRGRLTARLEAVTEPLIALTDDATLPDLVSGDSAPGPAGVVMVNATDRPVELTASAEVVFAGTDARAAAPASAPTTLPPMTARKVQVPLPAVRAQAGTAATLAISARAGDARSATTLPLRVRNPDDVRRVTFVSEIDGSVQYYAMRPASRPADTNGIVLSLHGASVEAQGQAEAYGPLADYHLVAPTNRRPFGFDWEDWGRLDGLEVLALAKASLPHDPTRLYLTGHSMGGHGTWHFGANHPGMFAAVAPSAGWISFATYSQGRAATPATRPALEAFSRASLPSDTLELVRNLSDTGIFILHGDADDNVPVAQARTMAATLGEFHTDFTIHEEPGAGHWWDGELRPGADCVDHPQVWSLFDRRRLTPTAEAAKVEFLTASPGVHATLHWVTVEQPLAQGELSKVSLTRDGRKVRGTLENVRRATIDASIFPGQGPITLELGEQTLTAPGPMIHLLRDGETWSVVPAATPAGEKNPARFGPLKLALQNRMAFVYATQGTDEENRLSLLKARYDAEMWQYRANGAVDVLPDTDPTLAADTDRTLVLYGNADTNAAWQFLPEGAPARARRGEARVGDQSFPGDQTLLFCHPRAGSDKAMVVALAPTSPRAARASMRLPVFTSGIAWPDYAVISADAPAVGPEAIRAAGFFDHAWRAR